MFSFLENGREEWMDMLDLVRLMWNGLVWRLKAGRVWSIDSKERKEMGRVV